MRSRLKNALDIAIYIKIKSIISNIHMVTTMLYNLYIHGSLV
jgi:hypothetical protein